MFLYFKIIYIKDSTHNMHKSVLSGNHLTNIHLVLLNFPLSLVRVRKIWACLKRQVLQSQA